MSQISTGSQTSFAISEIARNECRADGTAINAGYSEKSKTLIGGLTDSVKEFFGSYNDTSQFCSAYNNNEFSFATSQAYERQPLVDMAVQFNSCMQIASQSRFAVWIKRNGPAEVVFHGRFFTSGSTGITLNASVTYDGVKCYRPSRNGETEYVRGSELRITNEFTLTCRRQGTETNQAVVYRAANILVQFNGEPYPITLEADRVFLEPQEGPKSAVEANALIAELQGRISSATEENATLGSQIQALSSRRYFPRIAYVGQHHRTLSGARVVTTVPSEPDGAIIQFGCSFKDLPGGGRLDGRNGPQRRILGERMASRVCKKTHTWYFLGHEEGNNCGYDAYLFVCER